MPPSGRRSGAAHVPHRIQMLMPICRPQLRSWPAIRGFSQILLLLGLLQRWQQARGGWNFDQGDAYRRHPTVPGAARPTCDALPGTSAARLAGAVIGRVVEEVRGAEGVLDHEVPRQSNGREGRLQQGSRRGQEGQRWWCAPAVQAKQILQACTQNSRQIRRNEPAHLGGTSGPTPAQPCCTRPPAARRPSGGCALSEAGSALHAPSRTAAVPPARPPQPAAAPPGRRRRRPAAPPQLPARSPAACSGPAPARPPERCTPPAPGWGSSGAAHRRQA